MNIINESSLDYLDEITNCELCEFNKNDNVSVKPGIRDVGDISVGVGVGI